jgi:hypothetical protein
MLMRVFSGAVIMSLACALAGCRSDVSGVYVGISPTDAEMVQLVQASDGKISGRIEQALIKDDGSVSDESMAVEGVVDGSQIVLTPKASLSDGSGSQTGLIRGDTLELSWSGGHRSLKRSDAATFATEAGKVRTRATEIVADRDTRAGLAVLKATATQVTALSAAEPEIERGLTVATDRYKALSAALAEKQHLAASLRMTPGQGLASMRAGTDAQGIAVQINGLHGSIQQGAVGLTGRMKAIAEAMAPVRKSCAWRASNLRNSDFTSMCAEAERQKATVIQIAQKLDPQFSSVEVAYRQAIGGQ